MKLKDIFWPWGAVMRERDMIAECISARSEAARFRMAYDELSDAVDDLALENSKLLGRIDAYEASLRTAVLRDPKTGRMMKRGK